MSILSQPRETQEFEPCDGKFAILENSNFNFWNAQTKVLNSRLAAFTKIGETAGEALSMRLTFEADGIHTTTTIHGKSAPKQ